MYDTLVTDLRRARKLRDPRRAEHGDVLGDWLSDRTRRSAAARGARRATDAVGPHGTRRPRRLLPPRAHPGPGVPPRAGRGLLPAGLEEEIRALEHPPLPWDAQLARWFDEHVRAPEPKRTYARASRRQAATPDIPRPGSCAPEELTGG